MAKATDTFPSFSETVETLFPARCWLEELIETSGVEITDTSIGCGEAQLVVEFGGQALAITIKVDG